MQASEVRDHLQCSCVGFTQSLRGTDKVCKHAGVVLLIATQRDPVAAKHLNAKAAAKRRAAVTALIKAKSLPALPAPEQEPIRAKSLSELGRLTRAKASAKVSGSSALVQRVETPLPEVKVEQVEDLRDVASPLPIALTNDPWKDVPVTREVGISVSPITSAIGWDDIFEGYDSNADDACRLYEGGRLASIMSARQAQKMARYLIQKASKVVTVLAYTFDLQDMTDDLTQSRAPVEVFADQRTSMSQQTRKQLSRLIELRDNGITVWLGTGTDIQEEYAAAGRKVRPGQGILHAKCIRADNWMVCGSTNWTACSRCNTEVSVLIQLQQMGLQGLRT